MHSMVSGVRSTTSTGAALGRVGAGGSRACRARRRLEWRTGCAWLPRVAAVQRRTARSVSGLVRRVPRAHGEPHDRDVLTPGRRRRRGRRGPRARGRERDAGGRIVRVGNPTREHDGWESPHTVVEVVSDDAPFLVDSVSSALARRGLRHPPRVPPVARGRRRRPHVAPAPRDRPRDRSRGARRARATRSRAWSTTCSRRWPTGTRCAPPSPTSPTALRAAPPDGVAPDETAEVATYLDWLADDHFTFVGAVRVDADGVVGRRVRARRRAAAPAVRPRRCGDRGADRAAHAHPAPRAVDRAPRRAARLA